MLDVASTLVVPNARLPGWLQRTQTKDDGEKQINTNTVTLFATRNITLNFFRSPTMHAVTSQLYFSVQANKNLCQEKAPIYKLSRSTAFKTQQICHYKHSRKTIALF